jgi:lysophospholipase L1-like esterase
MARRRIAGALAAACAMVAILAGQAVPAERVRRLRRMVVVGDSLLAGYASGGFVSHGRPGQNQSAPAVIARRARVSLPQPLMDAPGVPPQLAIVDGNRNRFLDPGEVRRRVGLGFRARPSKRVRNLAVPGEDIESVNDRISPAALVRSIVSGDANGRNVLKLLILGLPLREDPVSQVSRARELAPTFLLVWIGSNDVLGMATRTNPEATRLTPAAFGLRFRAMLGALADTGAGMAVGNLPDVTGIAALRRAAGEVTDCRALDGTLRPVAADDLLPLDLARASLPTPPCDDVLDAAERAQVRATVVAFNAEIAAAIADVEARRGVRIVPVDLFAGFDALIAGVDLDGDGTVDLTNRYLGGVFSLDGIHPTRTGNALVANAFIDAINARFGEAIPRVDVARVARRDPLARSPFRPSGEAPFGLFAEPADQVEASFERAFERIEDRLDDIADEL